MSIIFEIQQKTGAKSLSKEGQLQDLTKKLEKVKNELENLTQQTQKPEYAEKAPASAKEKDR